MLTFPFYYSIEGFYFFTYINKIYTHDIYTNIFYDTSKPKKRILNEANHTSISTQHWNRQYRIL